MSANSESKIFFLYSYFLVKKNACFRLSISLLVSNYKEETLKVALILRLFPILSIDLHGTYSLQFVKNLHQK